MTRAEFFRPAAAGSSPALKHAPMGDRPEFHDLDAILPGDSDARRRLVAKTAIRIPPG